MQYETIQKNEMKIIGVKIVTTNENYQSIKDQKDLWERFFKENIGDRIPNKLNSGEVLGVYTDYESDFRGKYSFVVGYEVANFNDLPKDMVGLTIPATKYASFNNEEQITIDVKIGKIWQNIWESQVERTYKFDFEVYDLKTFMSTNPIVDICIGIK